MIYALAFREWLSIYSVLPLQCLLNRLFPFTAAAKQAAQNRARATFFPLVLCCLFNWIWFLTPVPLKCLLNRLFPFTAAAKQAAQNRARANAM